MFILEFYPPVDLSQNKKINKYTLTSVLLPEVS